MRMEGKCFGLSTEEQRTTSELVGWEIEAQSPVGSSHPHQTTSNPRRPCPVIHLLKLDRLGSSREMTLGGGGGGGGGAVMRNASIPCFRSVKPCSSRGDSLFRTRKHVVQLLRLNDRGDLWGFAQDLPPPPFLAIAMLSKGPRSGDTNRRPRCRRAGER